jgi:hypothetical protein
VISVLRYQPRRAVLRLDLSTRAELSSVGDGIRALSLCDQLLTNEACAAMANPGGCNQANSVEFRRFSALGGGSGS